MTIVDGNINWLKDGERASAGILNRPLKEVVNVLNTKFEEINTNIESAEKIPTSMGSVVNGTKIDRTVTDGQAVYFDKTSSTYKPAVAGNGVSSKFVGIYNKVPKGSGFEHRIITLGEANVPASLQANVIGTIYYLSTTPGVLTSNANQGGSAVGMCTATNKITVSNFIAAKPDLKYTEVAMQDGVVTYQIKYIPGRTMFFIEGILVAQKDITATNGTSVTIKNITPRRGDILSATIIQ